MRGRMRIRRVSERVKNFTREEPRLEGGARFSLQRRATGERNPFAPATKKPYFVSMAFALRLMTYGSLSGLNLTPGVFGCFFIPLDSPQD